MVVSTVIPGCTSSATCPVGLPIAVRVAVPVSPSVAPPVALRVAPPVAARLTPPVPLLVAPEVALAIALRIAWRFASRVARPARSRITPHATVAMIPPVICDPTGSSFRALRPGVLFRGFREAGTVPPRGQAHGAAASDSPRVCPRRTEGTVPVSLAESCVRARYHM